MRQRISIAVVGVVAVAALACSLTGGPAGEEGLEATLPPPSEAAVEQTPPPPEPTTASEPEEEKVETKVRASDGMEMVYIEAGEFLMGDDASPFPPEKPAHMVYLDEYWIDRLEVSNAQYRLCVEDGSCAEPRAWEDPNFNGDEQPVIVPWEAARAYCAWVGVRLPTEAEWEKAARGTDGRTWPWGDEFEPNRANLSGAEDGYGFTAPVGSFPGDVSPYGLLGMAGNAAEWVSDWFDADYYARADSSNPTGPASGEQRVHRAPIANGGGGPEKCRCTARYGVDPNWTYGLRCASHTPPRGEDEALPSSNAATTPSSAAEDGPEDGPKDGPEDTADSTGERAEGTDWPPLRSYRIRTVMTLPEEDVPEDVEGPVEQVFIFEWDGDIPISRMVIGRMEEITLGNRRWTRVGDGPWQEVSLSPEEEAAWQQRWSFAQFWGDAESLEDELKIALPEGIELVPAQIFPVPIKAAMMLQGEESVNGVHCRRYAVDTDLDYTQDLPGGGETHTTGHATGTIWVAHQEGIPPVIVRAVMDEDLMMDGDPSHPSWEHDITDINQSVVIEAPE